MKELPAQQRRMILHRRLTAGRPVIAAEVAKEWGCSERTVRRMLMDMRDIDRLPVEFDRVEQTWRYTRPVAQIEPLLVDVQDRRALLFSLQAAAQLEGTPVTEQVRRLYQTLLNTLPPEQVTSFQQMMESVRFTGPLIPPIKLEVWNVLLLCLEARETMNITYTDASYGRTTQRDVDPYGLIMRDRRWHLVAYCHRQQDVLTFSPQRIARAASTDRPFTMPARFMDQYLADNFDGWQSNAEKVKIVLRVAKDAPRYVHERQWSRNESRRPDDQGNTIIEFHASAFFAIEREVRAEGGYVEVLEPAHCRQELRRTAMAIARRHRARE